MGRFLALPKNIGLEVEVTNCDKHSSLLWQGINYNDKNIYSTSSSSPSQKEFFVNFFNVCGKLDHSEHIKNVDIIETV
jgi:hypothetical protein